VHIVGVLRGGGQHVTTNGRLSLECDALVIGKVS
jgi:hypothetical protein